MSKERGILFSAPMVRALLDGSKTQTRRALAAQPPAGAGHVSTYHHPDPRPMFFAWVPTSDGGAEISDWPPVPCPYGAPGDRLWVREAWSTHAFLDAVPPRDITTRSIHYWADGDCQTGKRRPGMFMPRWASRITLEVTGVRVERLQNISEADAAAEGVHTDPACPAYDGYRALWESINGAGSWEANPWVWVINFKRV